MHLSFPFVFFSLPPVLLIYFAPPCHELTTSALSRSMLLYMSLHLSSLFVPLQFPCSPLSFTPSCKTNTLPSTSIHLCPALPCSLLFITLPHLCLTFSFSSATSLSILISPCFVCFNLFSHPHKSILVLFLVSSSEGCAFLLSTFSCFFFFFECYSSHTVLSYPHLPFKSLNFFFSVCLLWRGVIKHWGELEKTKLEREKEREAERADLSRSSKR